VEAYARPNSEQISYDERIGKRNGGNTMKLTGSIYTAAFFLLIGMAVPAAARQEKQKENPAPARQQQEAKPEKQQQAQAPKQQQQHQQQAQAPKQQQQHQQQAQAPKQQQRQQQQAQAPKQQQQQRQQQTASSQRPQRSQQEVTRQREQPALRLSARGSGRIPDDRFRSNFGREHNFRIGEPVLVGGYSRFQYGGYWFGFVEPWPSGWYYTDDVYIDYVDGGYYMYDPYYPGTRFAISVVI
jgi:type IV secretory pathway VirB10-like protein